MNDEYALVRELMGWLLDMPVISLACPNEKKHSAEILPPMPVRNKMKYWFYSSMQFWAFLSTVLFLCFRTLSDTFQSFSTADQTHRNQPGVRSDYLSFAFLADLGNFPSTSMHIVVGVCFGAASETTRIPVGIQSSWACLQNHIRLNLPRTWLVRTTMQCHGTDTGR